VELEMLIFLALQASLRRIFFLLVQGTGSLDAFQLAPVVFT